MEHRLAHRTTVQCYSGYKGDERPTSFTVDGRTLQVADVADRWYDPDYNYFRVSADDGSSYLLRHDLNTDLWDLIEND